MLKLCCCDCAVTAWERSHIKPDRDLYTRIFILAKILRFFPCSFAEAYMLSVTLLPDMFAVSNHCSVLNSCLCSEWTDISLCKQRNGETIHVLKWLGPKLLKPTARLTFCLMAFE